MTEQSLVPGRTLEVHMDQGLIGRIEERNNLWAFRYTDAWRAQPKAFELTPTLPLAQAEHRDGASARPVQWFFDNLLPEAQARSYWAGKAGLDENDALAMLAHYGRESVGALTLLEPGQRQAEPGRRPLTDALLGERIRALPAPAEGEAAPKRMSIAGAQYKFAVAIEDGTLYDPIGSWPSTHLIKPDSKDEAYPHSAINEWFVMRLARACKLTVAEVRYRAAPSPYVLVERFDRKPAGKNQPGRRLHLLDACQLLGIDRTAKYRAATVEALQAIVALCAQKLATRRALFDWLLFNAIVGNDDNHLKNLSFFPGETGYLLAPAYDLLATAVYRILPPGAAVAQDWRTAELVFPIGDATRFEQLRSGSFVELGRMLGLPEAMVKKRIAELGRLVAMQADALLHEVQETRLADGQPVSAGELRLLRQIGLVVVQAMVGQLG